MSEPLRGWRIVRTAIRNAAGELTHTVETIEPDPAYAARRAQEALDEHRRTQRLKKAQRDLEARDVTVMEKEGGYYKTPSRRARMGS
jgi:hypothetical protein